MTLMVLSLLVASTAALWDWRTGTIPNWLTLPLLVLVPLGQWLFVGDDAALASVAGLLGCGLAPYILYRMGAIGGGDVKLFAVLGALNGLSLGISIFVTILLAGALQACLMLFVRGQLGQVLRQTVQLGTNLFRPPASRKKLPPEVMTEMRLGPALLLGTLVAFVGG
jgi:prepilin peptidase CpaA